MVDCRVGFSLPHVSAYRIVGFTHCSVMGLAGVVPSFCVFPLSQAREGETIAWKLLS